MKEYLIKISIPPPLRRELLCDFCGNELGQEFYASIYESEEVYVEEFLCEKCTDEYFSHYPVVPFRQVDKALQQTLLELAVKEPKGYIITGDENLPMDFFAKNPFLIPLWGEEI